MRYFKLVGAGKLEEIDAQKFEQVMRVAISERFHNEVRQPMYGFQYKGAAYIVLEDK